MERNYLIGVDIGTQGVKAVLFGVAGNALATAFRASQLHRPAPGIVEEDPDHQFETVCQCIAACVADSGIDPAGVAAMSIDGQMAGVIGIGEDGRHVTPYDSWLDTRCAPYIARMQEQAGDKIIRKTGGPASFNHGPKILWWKHERPEVYNQIEAFAQPGGYAVMRLCGMNGSDAFIDKSYLHFSGFADNARGCWDETLCREFDVEASKLPRIVDPHAVAGELTDAAARACQLKAGTPVIAGCGDTAASFLACGATQEGVCIDVAGTASVFAATTRQFHADTAYRTLGWGQSATPGLWHPYAYINGGGMNLEWFTREVAYLGKSPPRESLDLLDRMASATAPEATDPIFVPHLGGRVSPSQPDVRGSWAGLSWSHSTGHLYRAMLEGVALEYCIYRNVLKAVDPERSVREVRTTGGGARSAVWNQIKADALGIPLVRIARDEGAPLGVALLAGYGVGLFQTIEDAAAQWIRLGETVFPQRELAAHYEARLARYERLLECLP